MTIKELTERLESIETEIGTIKVNRSCNLFCASSMLLCASAWPTMMDNSAINQILPYLYLASACLHSIQIYQGNKSIQELKEEQSELKNERFQQMFFSKNR